MNSSCRALSASKYHSFCYVQVATCHHYLVLGGYLLVLHQQWLHRWTMSYSQQSELWHPRLRELWKLWHPHLREHWMQQSKREHLWTFTSILMWASAHITFMWASARMGGKPSQLDILIRWLFGGQRVEFFFFFVSVKLDISVVSRQRRASTYLLCSFPSAC